MKRIKFTELGFKKNYNTLIFCIGFIFLVIGNLATFEIINSKLKILNGISILLIFYPQAKNLFYKNYIYWNAKGGNIRLNSKSCSFEFENIRNVEINNEKLVLVMRNKSKEFSINDINKDDVNKLISLLKR
ncbi:hypothetical protein [Flavobacterium sp. U410]